MENKLVYKYTFILGKVSKPQSIKSVVCLLQLLLYSVTVYFCLVAFHFDHINDFIYGVLV